MKLVTLSDLRSFAPNINGCAETEPTLERLLMYYYMQVFNKSEAEDLVLEYLLKLKSHVNNVRSPKTACSPICKSVGGGPDDDHCAVTGGKCQQFD